MAELNSTLFFLLIILSFGLIVPELFKRLRIPFVTSLIILGAIIGPHGFNYIIADEIIQFFGFMGMTFLMLMAGLETDIKAVKKMRQKICILMGINTFIPFVTGYLITLFFGYSTIAALLIGTIFMSSSVAIIIPSLKSAKLFEKDVGKIILAAIMLADTLSLVFLAVILQGESPINQLSLPVYITVLLVSILAIFLLIPRLTNIIIKRKFCRKSEFEQQLRLVVALTFGVLIYFSLLGVHPILAAFIIGLALSQVINSKRLTQKLHTLGYGLFVPIFFVIIGMEVDISLLTSFDITNVLMISIILGLIGSKFISGFLGGSIIGLTSHESSIFGISSIIQLTTTLATVYAANAIGILDNALTTSVILLSIITTIVGPILLRMMLTFDKRHLKKSRN